MEPAWSKQIPNWLVCDWFYFLFLVVAAAGAVSLIAMLYVLSRQGAKAGGLALVYVLQLVLASSSALAYYLVCTRSLLAK